MHEPYSCKSIITIKKKILDIKICEIHNYKTASEKYSERIFFRWMQTINLGDHIISIASPIPSSPGDKEVGKLVTIDGGELITWSHCYSSCA